MDQEFIFIMLKRKWGLFMKFPSDWFAVEGSACFDKVRNLLFNYHTQGHGE